MKPKGAKTKNPKIQDARIKAVFNEVMNTINRGEKPNVFAIQKAYGYSDSSARSYAVTRTDAWEREKARVDKSKIMDTYLLCINKEEEDIPTLKLRMQAADRLAKILGLDEQNRTKVTFERKINLLRKDEEDE